MLQPFLISLIWVMRHVDGEVDEEWTFAVFGNERLGFFQHEIGKEMARESYPLIVLPEVVPTRTSPVEKMRVVVDAAAHESEGVIETLVERFVTYTGTEVPFADVSSGVTGGTE